MVILRFDRVAPSNIFLRFIIGEDHAEDTAPFIVIVQLFVHVAFKPEITSTRELNCGSTRTVVAKMHINRVHLERMAQGDEDKWFDILKMSAEVAKSARTSG